MLNTSAYEVADAAQLWLPWPFRARWAPRRPTCSFQMRSPSPQRASATGYQATWDRRRWQSQSTWSFSLFPCRCRPGALAAPTARRRPAALSLGTRMEGWLTRRPAPSGGEQSKTADPYGHQSRPTHARSRTCQPLFEAGSPVSGGPTCRVVPGAFSPPLQAVPSGALVLLAVSSGLGRTRCVLFCPSVCSVAPVADAHQAEPRGVGKGRVCCTQLCLPAARAAKAHLRGWWVRHREKHACTRAWAHAPTHTRAHMLTHTHTCKYIFQYINLALKKDLPRKLSKERCTFLQYFRNYYLDAFESSIFFSLSFLVDDGWR